MFYPKHLPMVRLSGCMNILIVLDIDSFFIDLLQLLYNQYCSYSFSGLLFKKHSP